MKRVLQRAVVKRAQEVLDEEIGLDHFTYLVQRKGFRLGDSKYFTGFASFTEWDEVTALIKKMYMESFRIKEKRKR